MYGMGVFKPRQAFQGRAGTGARPYDNQSKLNYSVTTMWDKLLQIEEKFERMEKELSDPSLVNDQAKFRETVRTHSELSEIVTAIRNQRRLEKELADAKEMAEAGGEMAQLAEEEVPALAKSLAENETALKALLVPRDPHDGKNVFMEIRAGTGGDEAALFAADLYRMYSRFADTQGWRVSVLDSSSTNLSGYKEITFQIEGKEVYRRMKFEAGAHRVQRVPATEASGRIHTFGRDRGRTAGDGRGGGDHQPDRIAHRYFLLLGAGRPERQHHLLGHPHHASADGHRGAVPGRAVPA